MKNKNLVLLGTLLKSTSVINILKYTKDKKKRGKIIGNIVGLSVVFFFLMIYCIGMCLGYGELGLADAIPTMCALLISGVAFIFTLLKTNGYLFNFKEYDMLMSLPFEVKTIAADKFMYMYVKSMPWFASISLSMMIGYGLYAKPTFVVYPLWVLLSLFVPIIPMLVAAFIGFIIAKISSGFKKTNLIQTILMFAFIILCFCSRFVIEAIFKNNQIEATIEQISDATGTIGRYYLPISWFGNAITRFGISDMLLLVGITILLFELLFIPVGKSYRQINSALASHAATKIFVMTTQKKRSLVNTIAYKEYKRLLGSTTYMTNVAVGEVMAFLLGVAVLFIGLDKVIDAFIQGAPVSTQMLFPAIPLISYFFIGMVASTACSPSLEGKNYWIIQSLPIDKKILYQGKMLFNMYLTVPFMLFATVCMCVSAKAPFINTVLYIIEGIVLCAFSTCYGCVCGIKHIRLDWVNEIEVIKQGAAVPLYMLPNMFVDMGLVVLVVFLGTRMNSNLIVLILTAIVAVLTVISYFRAMSLAEKK